MSEGEKRQSLTAGAPIRPIVPTTIEEAFRLAKWIVGAGLAPDSYGLDETTVFGGSNPDCAHKFKVEHTKTICRECGAELMEKGAPDPQKVVIGILKAMEVGLPPITGLSTIAIVRKRPVIWGDGAIALVQQAGLVERVVQFFEGTEAAGGNTISPSDFPDSFQAVFRIWRKGHETPYEGRFSVRDAQRAHLWMDTKKPIWTQYPKRMLMARARAFALREGFADALAGLSIREEVEDLPPEPTPTTDTSFLDDGPAPYEPPPTGGLPPPSTSDIPLAEPHHGDAVAGVSAVEQPRPSAPGPTAPGAPRRGRPRKVQPNEPEFLTEQQPQGEQNTDVHHGAVRAPMPPLRANPGVERHGAQPIIPLDSTQMPDDLE